MKRILPLILVLCMLLCACAKAPDETTPSTQQTKPSVQTPTTPTQPQGTTAPTTQPATTVPDTMPTLPEGVYQHPLTGVLSTEPMTTRPVFVVINNAKSALPLCGVGQADVVYEMLTNGYATRCLAVVTDVNAIKLVGAIRSLRYGFVDLTQAYDGIVVHAGGSWQVIDYLKASGVTSVDALSNSSAFFRDQSRLQAGYAKEHTLVGIPSVMADYFNKRGITTTMDANRNYGLRFAEDGTPADGVTANQIAMSFFTGNKTTTMNYNPGTGKYEYFQYGSTMVDGNTNETISFTNVFTLFADTHSESVFHVADLLGSGDGYYACGGKLVAIKWHHENPNDPFTYTLADGTPLVQGIGTSYIGIIPTGSAFSCK